MHNNIYTFSLSSYSSMYSSSPCRRCPSSLSSSSATKSYVRSGDVKSRAYSTPLSSVTLGADDVMKLGISLGAENSVCIDVALFAPSVRLKRCDVGFSVLG
eukprot:m.19513 g.19513  ORF g.19513 m.19513 type:complete len:101 (-) comp8470_c2_seq1:277-579(-)